MKEYKVINETTQIQNRQLVERGKKAIKKRNLKEKLKLNNLIRLKLQTIWEEINAL